MNKKRILIFDDDKSILDVFANIFAENGHDVAVSETSHDIIERVSDFLPDLILMDNWIPDIGGIEAIKLLKKRKEFISIPVIYISANSDISSLAKKAMANDFLAKPFDLADLEKKVNKFLI